MILLKTLASKSNPKIPQSLQRCIVSDASSSTPPTSLSSLFAKKPSKNSNFRKQLPANEISLTLSSLFRSNEPSTIKKSPQKDKKPSPNKQEKKVVGPTERRKLLEEKEFPKQLSNEATLLVSRLIEDGYLKDANFVKGEERLEAHQVPATIYSRNFLKVAAEKFGRDHQEIAKWLSGSDLKNVALFGCPSTERKSAYAAKRLRAFFHIQEEVVCRGCKLKTSCQYSNKKPVGTMDKVVLEDVMRLLTLYTLDGVSVQLIIPDEVKVSIDKLVKEAVSLSA